MQSKLFNINEIAAVIIGALIGIGGAYALYEQRITDLASRVDKMPPVVVVDFVKIAESYPADVTEKDLALMMRDTNNAIVKLKEAGYLVLDAASIVGAPEDVYLPLEAIGGKRP